MGGEARDGIDLVEHDLSLRRKEKIYSGKYTAVQGTIDRLGGSLDAFAGTVKRAPAWVSKIGMEWFYRLCKEPKRFKRMLRLPKFVFAVVGKRIRGK